MGAALRYFRDDVAPEDLTGFPVPLWHESMAPTVKHQSTPAPVPASVRAQLLEAKRTMSARAVPSSDALWLRMSEDMRATLLVMCTDRPTNHAHRLAWRDLTKPEREAIALQVRAFARECLSAYFLKP